MIQANVTRGIIAAVCCAAIFIIYGIVERFVFKRSSSRSGQLDVSTITSSYSKENGAKIHGLGVDNLGMEKRE